MQFPQNTSAASGGMISRCAASGIILLSLSASVPAGGSSCVHFDVPQIACCRLVHNGDHAQEASELAVEASFDVSTLLRFGQESQVQQLLFVIESPARSLRVLDYAPKTELTSLYVGHIEQNRQYEESNNAGLGASFAPTEFLNAQTNAARAAKSNESVRFQTVPPMQLLAASGTVARGTAVYFKFKATPQTTLDGSRTLRVMFHVPKGWRADYVYLRCAAYGRATAGSESPLCGSNDFLVPLFLEGDASAEAAARELAVREIELRQLARQWQARGDSSAVPSLSEKLTALFRDEKRRVPELWLTNVLTSVPDRREFSFQSQLPTSLRRALSDFTEARWQLVQMNP